MSEASNFLQSFGSELHDDDAVEAALAALPAPRAPGILLDKLCAVGVTAGDVLVDLGCGHGQYAVDIAASTGCDVIALDVSRERVIETLAAATAAGTSHVWAARAAAEAMPLRGGCADFVWCRDMLNHVDLLRTLAACAAVLRAGGHMVVYQTFASDLLEPREAKRIYAAFTIVERNMDVSYFEKCAVDAGFSIIERDVIGGEWREWWETEGSRKTSENLMRAARLLRGEVLIRERLGDAAYEFAMADQLWGVHQMIGKLVPTAYVLRRA